MTPVWKQRIQRSLHLGRSKHESKYFQVASVSHSGLPCVRTMVFRGFKDEDHRLYAVTDIRSDKVSDFIALPKTQICWYFAKTREQFRFSCNAFVIKEGPTHLKYWHNLSETAKQGFYSKSPKVPFDDNEKPDTISESHDINTVSKNFCVIEFEVTSSDYLDLKSKPQYRELESLNSTTGDWFLQRVNP